MKNCKRHGKPKDSVWYERQRNGGELTRIGCADCKAAALSGNRPGWGRNNVQPRPGFSSFLRRL